jgi:hypothetical protein
MVPSAIRVTSGCWLTPEVLSPESGEEEKSMLLYTLAVILLIAWLLGVVGTYTIGAFVHVLLVIAIVLFILGFVTGRRPIIP